MSSVKTKIPLCEQFDTPEYVRDYTPVLKSECRSREWWIVEVGGLICGVLRLVGNETRYVIVRDGYRGQGVGASLIAYAKFRRRTSWGKTKKGNSEMRRLFEKEGFRRAPDRDEDDWMAFEWER